MHFPSSGSQQAIEDEEKASRQGNDLRPERVRKISISGMSLRMAHSEQERDCPFSVENINPILFRENIDGGWKWSSVRWKFSPAEKQCSRSGAKRFAVLPREAFHSIFFID